MISMIPTPTAANQIPLVVTVHEDDELLYNSPHSEGYRILKGCFIKIANSSSNPCRSISRFGDNDAMVSPLIGLI